MRPASRKNKHDKQRQPPGSRRARWRPPRVPPSRTARLMVLGVIFFLLLLLSLLGVVRYYGLPEQATVFLKTELQRRGIEASFGKLYLDPLGRVVGRQVKVVKVAGSDQHQFDVERIRFDLNWLSWWRGEPLISGLLLEEASIRYALAEGSAINLSRVRLDLALDRHKLVIRGGSLHLAPLEVRFSGVIRASEWKLPTDEPPLSEEERERRVALWRGVETALAQIHSQDALTVHVEVDLDLDDLVESRGRIWMDERRLVVAETNFRQVAWSIEYENERAEVHGKLAVGRGELGFRGLWFQGATEAQADFQSNIDLSLLSGFFPGNLGELIASVEFRSLPKVGGEVEFNWAEGFRYAGRIKADWQNFRIRDATFDRLELLLSYDGSRLLINDLNLEGPSGRLTGSWFFDENREVKARLESSLDPTALRGFFGSGAQPFFASLRFSGGPEVKAHVTGSGLDPEGWAVRGSLVAKDFRYKGVSFEEIRGDFVYSNGKIYSPNLFIQRTEGTGQAEVWHDFRNEMAWIRNGQSTLNPSETATIFGDVFARYVSPYRFLKPPKVAVGGLIDLKSQRETNLTLEVVAPAGMDFDFLGKEIRAEDLNAQLVIRGTRIDIVPNQPVRIFGGQLRGQIHLDISGEPARFRTELDLSDWQFDRVMRTYFGGDDDLGGRLSGSVALEGAIEVMDSLRGGGQLSVRDGALYRIPIYGAFSEVLNVFIPGLGYAKASNAKADFRFENGNILIDSVNIFSLSAVMIGRGRYDYINDRVDMDMRVNLRGPIGLVFFPVSKLFEYHGSGPLNNTKWEAKIFE